MRTALKRIQVYALKQVLPPVGQSGHEGKTLECHSVVGEVIKYSPSFCNCCGYDLSAAAETLVASRQVLDIAPIFLQCTEHRVFKKQCPCGKTMEGNFPVNVAAKVQYGPNTEALVGYLHARQYLPYTPHERVFE